MTTNAVAAATEIPFFIGTYTGKSGSEGIYSSTLNTETGAISAPKLAAKCEKPSFLVVSADGKFLYSTEETSVGMVSAYQINSDASLTLLNSQPAGGAVACHVFITPDGKYLLVANYTGGNIAAFPIRSDGSLGERSGFVQFVGSGIDPNRQKAPHAHSIYAIGDTVYACDLGTDKIWTFKLVDGSFVPAEPDACSVPGGGGPRHLAFGPGNQTAYVVNEMGLSMSVLDRDPGTGTLTHRETFPTHSEKLDGVSLSAVFTHPTGKFVYITSRGDDEIHVFGIGTDGGLTLIERVSAGVKIPRGFRISPDGRWLVVAGQGDHRLAVFSIDPNSGKLKATGHETSVGAPCDVVFLP